jgi:hypothetical protein
MGPDTDGVGNGTTGRESKGTEPIPFSAFMFFIEAGEDAVDIIFII